jgi:protein TonB
VKYALPAPPQAPWNPLLKLAIVVGLHAVLLLAVLSVNVRPPAAPLLANLDVRLMESKPPSSEPETTKPSVPRPQVKQTEPLPEPPPLVAAAAEAPVPASFSVPEQAPALATVAPAAAVAARFDADYLHNPAPIYPHASRRNQEEGRVLLKVLVSAEGTTKRLQIEQSSGFARLDDAAVNAVRQWRFVAARRGNEVLEDWVLVPINFRLDL